MDLGFWRGEEGAAAGIGMGSSAEGERGDV